MCLNQWNEARKITHPDRVLTLSMQKHQHQVGPWYYPDALFDVSGTSVLLLSHSTASWLQLLLQSSSVSADDLPSCCRGKQKPSDEYYFIWPPSNAQPPTSGPTFPTFSLTQWKKGLCFCQRSVSILGFQIPFSKDLPLAGVPLFSVSSAPP